MLKELVALESYQLFSLRHLPYDVTSSVTYLLTECIESVDAR
jgi:hypothetical protein